MFSNNICPFLGDTLKTNKSTVVFAVQWLFCGFHSHALLGYVWMRCFGWKSEINFAACVKWADHSRCKQFTQTNKSLWSISWWTDSNLVSAAFQLCLGVSLKLQIVVTKNLWDDCICYIVFWMVVYVVSPPCWLTDLLTIINSNNLHLGGGNLIVKHLGGQLKKF